MNTEPGNGRDVSIITPSRSRSETSRFKKETLALAQRLTPFLIRFMSDALIPVIKDLRRENLALQHRLAVAENTIADRTEIKAIKTKLAEFETSLDDAMIFRGVWRQDHTFERGSAVVRDGALWFAERATDRRPGTPDSGWRLTVKSGAWNDAR